MDTSKKYILMSEKAVEIQKGWIPKDGDFVGESKGYSSMAVSYTDLVNNEGRINIKKIRPNWLYLPRQDQLQEMLHYTLKFELLEDFRMWYIATDATGRYNSMEQLWLGFIMFQKYNKGWDETNKDWVNHEKI